MIYEIICNETQERYIGSTFEPTLARRLAYHRSNIGNTCSSKQIIGRGNYYINLLETVDTKNRDLLRMKEREWYDKLPNINKMKPFVSKEERKEYCKILDKKRYENNREAAIEYAKKRYEENREAVRENAKKRYENNRERFIEYARNRRALKKGLDPAQFS